MTRAPTPPRTSCPPAVLWSVALAIAAGLTLRLAAAQGGLWLDEAWSAVFARDSGTPAAVFWRINHDNNHHLNTLWLQLVGFDAPPMLQRALAIVSGTLAIPVAAAIGWRRGALAAACLAWAFALSPALVTLGAEARGYAPMLLAFTLVLWRIDRWLDDPARSPPGLALLALLGTASQGLMVLGLALVGCWSVIVVVRRLGPAGALLPLLRCSVPPLLATGGFLLLVWLAARADPAGFRMGNAEPHSWHRWLDGVLTLWRYALGGLFALALLALPFARGDRLLGAALLGALGLPLAIGLAALPNDGSARYHLLSGVALLIGVALVAARALAHARWRWPVAALVALTLAAMLLEDAKLLANQRGDPARAVAALPAGASVHIQHPRSAAVLEAAAAAAHRPLTVRERPCPAADAVFVERVDRQTFAPAVVACGVQYRPVAERRTNGLSGTHWRLYARAR